jgi:hypothetical protein
MKQAGCTCEVIPLEALVFRFHYSDVAGAQIDGFFFGTKQSL